MPTQTLAKRSHLLNRNGRYWARLSVPEALRPIIMKRELLEPLGPDRTQALRKLPGAVGRMQDVLNTVISAANSRQRAQISKLHFISHLRQSADLSRTGSLGVI